MNVFEAFLSTFKKEKNVFSGSVKVFLLLPLSLTLSSQKAIYFPYHVQSETHLKLFYVANVELKTHQSSPANVKIWRNIMVGFAVRHAYFIFLLLFQHFPGNNDTNTVQKSVLTEKVYANYVRIWPTKWFHYPCMRIELYGRAPGNKTGKASQRSSTQEETTNSRLIRLQNKLTLK